MTQNKTCVRCGELLSGRQKKYCSNSCSSATSQAKAREAKKQEQQEDISKFRGDSRSTTEYRAALMEKYRAGHQLTRNELVSCWNSWSEYLEIRQDLLAAVENDRSKNLIRRNHESRKIQKIKEVGVI